MKVLVLVSALYLLTARNDEVQFCDKPGQGADFINRLLSSTHEMRVVDALRVNVNVFGILKDSLGEMLAPLKQVKNVMARCAGSNNLLFVCKVCQIDSEIYSIRQAYCGEVQTLLGCTWGYRRYPPFCTGRWI
jgi:hypothetical protein